MITLDLLLPGMDGWEFLAAIKNNSHLGNIPVVIISILSDFSRGISLGAADVLQKPVLSEDLSNALIKLGLTQQCQSGKEVTALIIDDDPNVVEIIASHLRKNCFRILSAHGGAEGIRIAQDRVPDLIILDLMMPEISGFEVVEALKLKPETTDIPILILTAKLLTQEDRSQLNGQVKVILEKSEFNHGNFISEVKRALGSKWKKQCCAGNIAP